MLAEWASWTRRHIDGSPMGYPHECWQGNPGSEGVAVSVTPNVMMDPVVQRVDRVMRGKIDPKIRKVIYQHYYDGRTVSRFQLNSAQHYMAGKLDC